MTVLTVNLWCLSMLLRLYPSNLFSKHFHLGIDSLEFSCGDIFGNNLLFDEYLGISRSQINWGNLSKFYGLQENLSSLHPDFSLNQEQKTSPTNIIFLQVILFEIDCAIFYTNLHKLFCHFISWTNWVNSGKFMDNCWISCQVMADMKKVYDDLLVINL